MKKLKIRSLFLKTITIIFIVNLFVSCQKKEITIGDILSKSLEAHGGLEIWQQVDTLSFTKKTILYNREGLKEKEITQHQSFYGGGGFARQTVLTGASPLWQHVCGRDDLYFDSSVV